MDVDSSTDTPFAAAGSAPFGTVPPLLILILILILHAATTIIAATPEVRGDGDGVFWELSKLDMAVGRVLV